MSCLRSRFGRIVKKRHKTFTLDTMIWIDIMVRRQHPIFRLIRGDRVLADRKAVLGTVGHAARSPRSAMCLGPPGPELTVK